MRHLFFIALIIFITGCATTSRSDVAATTDMKGYEKSSAPDTPPTVMPDSAEHDTAGKNEDADAEHLPSGGVTSEINKERPRLDTSLLKSDQVILSEQALDKILSSRVVLPSKGHLAITQYPGAHRTSAYFGNDYWRSEAYLNTQKDYIDTLSDKISESDRIVAVTVVPSLLSPKDASIPVLREAAVRLQADLLLAFRITSDIYQEYKQPLNDSIKAFSICEAVLMDTRTGLIPYTAVATGENIQELISADTDLNEARNRAEKEAVLASLREVAREITEFLRSVP